MNKIKINIDKQKSVYCVKDFNGVDAYYYPKAMFSLEEVVIHMTNLSKTEYPKVPIRFDEDTLGYHVGFILDI